VYVALAAVAPSQTIPFNNHLRQWYGGEITHCDLEYVHYFERSSNVISAVADLLKRSGDRDTVIRAASGPYAVETKMHIRRDAALIVRRTLSSPHKEEEGAISAVAWCSKTMWGAMAATRGTTFVTVDCEKGAKYGTALDALRDVHGDLGAVATWPLLIMACGLPGDVRDVRWNGLEFTGLSRSDGGVLLHGTLAPQDGDHFILKYRRGGVSLSDTNAIPQAVSLSVNRDDRAFPATVKVGDGSDAEVFSNIVLRTGPAVNEDVPFSVTDFVKREPSVALVTIISNGWQYAAYSGGRWIQSPSMTRVKGDLGTAWSVRAILGALLLTPLLVAARRRFHRL
jgi:hypothetical protein